MVMHRCIAIYLALCAITAVAQTSGRRQPGDPMPAGHVIMHVSRMQAPKSLLDLIRMSQLVVDGTISGRLPVINTGKTNDHPMFETHSVVAVNSIVSASLPKNAAQILLAELGGHWDKWDMEVAGDSLVSPSERYILFLNPDDGRNEVPNSSGLPRYAVTGVWSGKIKVTNGVVIVSASLQDELHTYNNSPADTFLETLREKIRRPYTTDKQLPVMFAPGKL